MKRARPGGPFEHRPERHKRSWRCKVCGHVASKENMARVGCPAHVDMTTYQPGEPIIGSREAYKALRELREIYKREKEEQDSEKHQRLSEGHDV